MEEERANCGIFKGKQKKALKERLETIENPRLSALEKEVETNKKERNSNVDKRIAEILKDVEPYAKEKQQLIKRQKEIDHELTRDR